MKLICLCILSLTLFTGCAHQLEVKNLKDYQVNCLPVAADDLRIGVVEASGAGQLLATGVAEALAKYADKVIYPYSTSNSSDVQIITKLSISERHKGSGANFFINFPGFLVWAPAWNGYVYKPAYDITVDLVKAGNGEHIDTFTVPIDFDVRQSEFDRTWTEISWLECGAIALVGGFVAITYDSDITPTVEQAVKTTVGDYVASKIFEKLSDSRAMNVSMVSE